MQFDLTFGKNVALFNFLSCLSSWLHFSIFTVDSVDDVEGIDLMRWEDQEKIRKYVEGGSINSSLDALPSECAIEVSQTSRASCKHCGKKIDKGIVGYLWMSHLFHLLLFLLACYSHGFWSLA